MVVPRTTEDIVRVIEIAAEEGTPVLARGGGTSQCGQTVAEALVVDTSKYLNAVLDFDAGARTVRVQPGVVLDQLNRFLKPHGLFFPIDPSTASRATIGGMAGNNSCGARSIRYGNMVHNVRAIDAVMADGETWNFGPVPAAVESLADNAAYRDLVARLRAIAAREADQIDARWPKLLRRVGGYNIDTIAPGGHNMARLLVGSEGTLAFFTAIELDLQPIPAHTVLGVCRFSTFSEAMEATRHIVGLEPAAVEVVDRTMIDLARDIPAFRATVERLVDDGCEALLMVEFAGDDETEQKRRLESLADLMSTLGFPGAMMAVTDGAFQHAVWEVRKAGLNIMMSMKGDGKPVSFIEDCAVPLEHLGEYTERLNRIFEKHGTRGTWYAHASVGCLHVRPVLNMKAGGDVRKMRAIAEETFAMVRDYKGSHSGEHGDGIVRSEFHEFMFGSRIVRALEDIKDAFDPQGLFNPGRIVRPPRMDDRSLFRYKPGYAPRPIETVLDWSEWGGFAGAVEMCNNNGACRKSDADVMCPSFRVTRDEIHVTRGRANTLRLAITGQLGPDALVSDAMAETMDLCIGCKGCKRECPTGVDMARMKIEFLHHYHRRHGLPLRERVVANLPRYAPWAARLAFLLNLRDRVPGLPALSERLLGLSARRPLPRWRRDVFRGRQTPAGADGGRELVLFVDTFNTYFEPENARAAVAVLGYRVARDLFGEMDPLGKRIRIAPQYGLSMSFLVVGVMEKAGNIGFRNVDEQVLVPITIAMRRMFGLDFVTSITITARSSDLVAECMREVKLVLRKQHELRFGQNDDFRVVSQEQALKQVREATRIFEVVLYAIASISLVVGGIGIMNIMLVSVTERTREVGVRIAVGAQRWNILVQFLAEAATISLLGGAFGVGGGYAFCAILEYLVQNIIQTYTPPKVIAIALVVAVLIGIISGISPAFKASRLDPVEALRYE